MSKKKIINNTVVKKVEKSETEVVKNVQYECLYRAPVQQFFKTTSLLKETQQTSRVGKNSNGYAFH